MLSGIKGIYMYLFKTMLHLFGTVMKWYRKYQELFEISSSANRVFSYT